MAKHKEFNPDCPDCVKVAKRPRFYRGGTAHLMTRAKGWVMARKRGAAPFVIPEKEWAALPFVG